MKTVNLSSPGCVYLLWHLQTNRLFTLKIKSMTFYICSNQM